MSKLSGREAIYRSVEIFKSRCLEHNKSMLWSDYDAWSLGNLQAVRNTFFDNIDMGAGTFFDKLQTQLLDLPTEAHRIAIDTMFFYYLFPNSILAKTKLDSLDQMARWKFTGAIEPPAEVRAALESGGIGKTGVYYNTGLPWQFGFYLTFFEGLKSEPSALRDANRAKVIADEAETRQPQRSGAARHVALHLLFPSEFEAIASTQHKETILKTFIGTTEYTGLDNGLSKIRARLEKEYGKGFSYYQPEVQKLWRAAETVRTPRVWVEKTIISGRPDRNSGPHALGKALWSPTKSRAGADIYRFMRDIHPGDYILHLTDNSAITGVSVARARVENFEGVPGTGWEGDCYRVALTDFEVVNPPLNREQFFTSPFRERMLAAASGAEQVFFTSGGELRQGAYLTPVPPALLHVLNDAYEQKTGRVLLDVEGLHPYQTTIRIVKPPTPDVSLADIFADFARAISETGLNYGGDQDELLRAFFASAISKPFVLLTGLSGSGKTQLGIRFGEWLGTDRMRVIPVRPDWTGSEQVFGFEDLLRPHESKRPRWVVPPVLDFILKAAADQDSGFALVLDEMNLAHVERYFADALSGIESEQPCVPNVELTDGNWLIGRVPALLFPKNLFVIGTVNVDETTYMFSPKVLDRANTMEIRTRSDELMDPAPILRSCKPAPQSVIGSMLRIARDRHWQNEHPAPYHAELATRMKALHLLLSSHYLEFGQRVYAESLRFAAIHSACGDDDVNRILDRIVLQKILPRIHGSRRRIEKPLTDILAFCHQLQLTAQPENSLDPSIALLPRAFEKTRSLLARVRTDQFASFTD